MRRYDVTLDRVLVPYHQHELAATIASQVLEARLGGPQGVVDAWDACLAITGGDPRWPVPDTASRAECAAVKRWRRATDAALDAIARAFDQVFVGLTPQDIELARADEHLSITPLRDPNADTAAMLADARIGLPPARSASESLRAV